jgi:hypothetical protein
MTHAVNFRPNTIKAGLDPYQMHVGFLVDKWLWQGFCAGYIELSNECCLNIHETKINSVNFNIFLSSF